MQNLNTIKQKIDSAQKIAIFGHTDPDGDAIWAMLWLWSLLEKQSKDISYFTPTKPWKFFDFINNINEISDEFNYSNNYDLLIFLDFTSLSRIKSFYKDNEDYFQNQTILQIDHHTEDAEKRIDYTIKDKESISTCELVFETTYKRRPELFDAKIATHLYLWITTDSWNFQFDNDHIRTFSNALKLLKLWANKKLILKNIYDTQSLWSIKILQRILKRFEIKQDFIYSYFLEEELEELNIERWDTKKASNILKSIESIELSLVLWTHEWYIRWSLRWKWKYDCTKIANIFDGGWHKNAAWFAVKIEKDFETTKTNIINNIYKYIT